MRMEITAEYFGHLKNIGGMAEETLTLPNGAPIAEAVEEIVRLHGQEMERALFTDRAHGVYAVQFLVNGAPATAPSATLKQGDRLKLLLRIGGG